MKVDLSKKQDRYFKLRELVRRESFSHNTFTPMELVDEIIAASANVLTEDAEVLVLFNPEFAVSLLEDYPFLQGQITLYHENDPVTEKLSIAMGINTITSLEQDMKFDLVLGNPPFQKGHDAKRWTLWKEFVERAFEISDCVAFVTPQSITGPRSLETIKGASILNLDVSKHFSVASTFCYWVVDKNRPAKYTQVVTEDESFELDFSSVPFLPLDITDHNLELLNLLLSRDSNRTWKRGEFHTTNKVHISKNTSGTEVFHTNAQTLHVKKSFAHDNLGLTRVAVSLSGYPEFKVVKDTYCSQATLWTEFKTVKEAEKFAKDCNGKDVQEMLKVYKWSGWNSKEVISLL
jgi:predicted RNA methylase